MKLIKAYIHHIRTAEVVQALADAGFRNITLQNVMGMLKPLSENEQAYSIEAGGLVISEVRLSLVCEDLEVAAVTEIIRRVARIGPQISGWVYVSPVEQAMPIGGEVA
jgi:nitrogen regulatory protein P-II 1